MCEACDCVVCICDGVIRPHRWLLEQLTEREGDPHEFGRVFSDSVR